MESTKTRSDINDFRNDNYIYNVLDSLEETVVSTLNRGWMRDEDLLGNFSLRSGQI